MPDILLLPELCDILGTSADALLEMPIALKNKNIVQDFCSYARERGRSAALVDAASRMFNDTGTICDSGYVDFGCEYLRVYDKGGMSFTVDGKDILTTCLETDSDDVAYVLRILLSENLMSVLRLISMDKAITREEIAERTGLGEDAINQILTGLFKRGIIVFEKDAEGKRGYLQSEGMAGIYMILAGCRVMNAAGGGYNRFSRTGTELR
ncbi:MAG: MarR family transcriptional regulator [Lachnospiraceae bacterium]|nr:MarR family transcriptional regulator [Lachnospiraceae bacterium]